MSENTEIEDLLKNIQEGLKNYSIKELNEAIVSALNKKSDRNQEISLVLDLVCAEFSISLRTLKKAHARGYIQEAKQTAYCLLHFELGLGVKHIAKRVFSNWHKSVCIGIDKYRKANPSIKSDREFCERYQKLQKQFAEKIVQLKQQKNESLS